VRRILDEQYTRARDIINKRRQALEEGAQLLLKKEKIEGKELKVILDKETLPDSSA